MNRIKEFFKQRIDIINRMARSYEVHPWVICIILVFITTPMLFFYVIGETCTKIMEVIECVGDWFVDKMRIEDYENK